MRNNKERIKECVPYLCLLFVSIGFVLVFSYSTSQLYPYFFGNDSAHFMTIGKAWAYGRLPYRDMFDHKGPIIYFIDMIGFFISEKTIGIFCIQIIFIFFTLLAAYRTLLYLTKHSGYTWLGLAFFVLTLKMNYIAGNTVEEYCLPFLGWSMYGLARYFGENKVEHNYKLAFFYGITTGVCLFTRATNIMAISGLVLVICIRLIYNKKFKNLLDNGLMFIAGSLVVILPFVIYFGANNALGEMLYDVFIFNIAYMNKCPSWILSGEQNVIESLDKYFLIYFMLVGLVGLCAYRKKWIRFWGFLITLLVETYIFFNGYLWGQYPLVCVSHSVILFGEITELKEENEKKYGFVSHLIIFLLIVLVAIRIPKYLSDMSFAKNTYGEYHEREWSDLIEQIPKDDYNSVIVYGNDNLLKEFYLLNNIVPCYKYYLIQDWIAGFSDKIRDELIRTYKYGSAKWMLVENANINLINDILDERYYEVDSTLKYSLYKLK